MAVWRIGEQGWRFAVPLLLLGIAVDGGHANVLAMPAAYGLLTSLANALLGPSIGAAVDGCRSRARPVALAACVTGTCVGVGGFIMCSLPSLVLDGPASGEGRRSPDARLWLVVVAASVVGAIESLASMVTMVALSRDWVPLLCEERARQVPAPAGGAADEESYLLQGYDDTDGDDERHRRADEYNSLLTRVNSAVSTVNLLGETAAPLAAGLILTIPYSFRVPDSSMDVDVGGVIVAGIGTLSPLLACLVLMRVFRSSASLQTPTVQEGAGGGESTGRFSIAEAWLACVRHEYGVALIVFAYSSLYLSALSSHGILLTAFLKAEGASPTVLGVFRGAGALSGVVGVSLFPAIVSMTSLRSASTAYIALLVVGVSSATAAYVIGHGGLIGAGAAGASAGAASGYVTAFMAMIVVSRAGLYGYEVGLMQHQQLLVDERTRSTIGGFENALCNLATISLYGLGIAFGKPEDFGLLVLTGTCAVTTSLLLYLSWRYLWPDVYHTHSSDGGDDSADHSHIAQDERTKSHTSHHHPIRRARSGEQSRPSVS